MKTGILAGSAPWICITDADGTYPVEKLALLVKEKEGYDMVVGVRTGTVKEIPWARRLPKSILNWFASYLAGARIRDLNSGMSVDFTSSLGATPLGTFSKAIVGRRRLSRGLRRAVGTRVTVAR